jgi:prepilin-type N-terminal cleavage/methylation domain-containing protein
MKISNNRGFTLIELMVVVSIIALLSSIVYASLQSTRVSARDSVRMQQVRQMDLAISLFKSDHDGAVPNLASVSGGAGCSYSSSANVENCIAKSSGGEAWSAFVSEIQPYMRNVPVGTNGVDYVYMPPAAMGPGANNSSYQISSNLEGRPAVVTGYTTGSSLVSYPPSDGSTYKITFTFSDDSAGGDASACTIRVNSTVTGCNSVLTGLTNGSYILTYVGGYIPPVGAYSTDISFNPPSPVTINSANANVTIFAISDAAVEKGI